MRDRKPENRVLAVVAVLTGLGMAVLPTAGLSILTPWVMQRLALPASTAALLQTAYPVGLILTALPMAALAARIGPRRGFLAALLALALLVPAAALPLDFAPLVGLRFLAGGASALLLCAGWSLLRRVLGEARLGLGLGLAELAVLPALLLVQISAGFALSSFGSLGILVPTLLLAVPSLILGVIALPETEEARPRFDGLGAVLSVLCLGLLLAAAALAAVRPVMALLVLNLGLMLSGLWVWQQWRRPAPLLPLDLLARPGLAGPLAAALAGGLVLTGVDVALPLHLKALGGLSLESVSGVLTGLAGLAAGAGFLAGRSGAPRLARIGMGLAAAGLAALAWGGGAGSTLPVLVVGLLAVSIGHGLFTVGNRLAVLRAAAPARTPAAAGLLVLAGGLGTLFGPLCIGGLPTLFVPAGAVSAGHWLGLAAGVALIAAGLSRAGGGPAAQAGPPGGRLAREPS